MSTAGAIFTRVTTQFSQGVLRLGAKNNFVILTYHRVLDRVDPFLKGEIDKHTFEWQMATLARYFKVVPLAHAVTKLVSGSLDAGSVAVTFDDGYLNNFTNALPILQRHKIPATFFVASGFLDGGIMWNDRLIESIRHTDHHELNLAALDLGTHCLIQESDKLIALNNLIEKIKYMQYDQRNDVVAKIQDQLQVTVSNDLMMCSEQVKQLSELGMEIGGHTQNHPILSKLPDQLALREIVDGREQLEEITGTRLRCFAYPNGRYLQDYDDRHVSMLKKIGVNVGVSTEWGSATKSSNLWNLPRCASWDRTALRYYMRMVQCLRMGDPIPAKQVNQQKSAV